MYNPFNEICEKIILEKKLGAINKIGDYFIKTTDIEKKDYIADFLLASARDKISQIVIVLITIHILRKYSQTTKASIDLAQRTLMRWPLNFRLRYTYSNCLNMTKSVSTSNLMEN